MKSQDVVNEDAMLAALDEADKSGGINNEAIIPDKKPKTLGKSVSYVDPTESTISMANDVRWKILPFQTLPSNGLFYPEDSEISIRSADVMEIRHWSTIDENDMVSINDSLNFILEKCVKFKIKGRPVVLTWRDLLLMDRFFIIFKVHELTFPNGENKLMKLFDCTSCAAGSVYSDWHQVRGDMLQKFIMPEELQEFYREDYRTFSITSERIGDFYINMPTLGAFELVKRYITEKKKRGKTAEKWFIKVAPYLIEDYQALTVDHLDRMMQETMSWNKNKLYFFTKAVDLLEAAHSNNLVIKCPKCNNLIEKSIFSSNSFTVKNLFVVSTRLADLI